MYVNRRTDCGREHFVNLFLYEFLSYRCKHIRVDVQESERLQEWARRVPESLDSVVRELKKIVMEQLHAIVGLSALVGVQRNVFIPSCLTTHFLGRCSV